MNVVRRGYGVDLLLQIKPHFIAVYKSCRLPTFDLPSAVHFCHYTTEQFPSSRWIDHFKMLCEGCSEIISKLHETISRRTTFRSIAFHARPWVIFWKQNGGSLDLQIRDPCELCDFLIAAIQSLERTLAKRSVASERFLAILSKKKPVVETLTSDGDDQFTLYLDYPYQWPSTIHQYSFNPLRLKPISK